MEHFFSPNSSRDLRSDAYQSQIIGGDADEDHTQIIGGNTVKLLGVYIPTIPSRFSTPDDNIKFALVILNKLCHCRFLCRMGFCSDFDKVSCFSNVKIHLLV